MPSLGADMAAGQIVEWLVEPGDHVKRGDIIAVVETEKGAIEIEIFDEGKIQEVLVPVGEKAPVGMVLALLDGTADADAVSPTIPTLEESVTEEPRPLDAASPPETPFPATDTAQTTSPEPSERLRITPTARRRAAELGIDPSTLSGSGAAGAIILADIEAMLPEVATPTAPPTPEEPADRKSAIRHAIGAAMSRSNREIPHYYLGTTIDMEPTLNWIEATNKERPVTERLLSSALLLRAVGLALRQVPDLNGFWEDGAFRPGEGIHVGWSISLRGGGLIAPAIHDVDQKPIPQLMTEFRDLVKRTRQGGLRSSEMTDATITITSLGDQGVQSVFGMIYPPQVGLIGFGKIYERVWTNNGMIDAHRVIEATLSGDHRASDGHTGGQLLSLIDRLLQEPSKL